MTDQAATATEETVETSATETPPADKGTLLGNSSEAEAPSTEDTSSTAEAESQAQAEIKLALPEGSLLNDSDLEALLAEAKDRGLSQAEAEASLKQKADFANSIAERAQEAFAQQAADWRKELENDPELGRANLPKTNAAIERVMREFAPPELVEALNDSGYGNFPPLVKMIAAIGARMAEDSTGQGDQAPATKSPGEDFYSKANKA